MFDKYDIFLALIPVLMAKGAAIDSIIPSSRTTGIILSSVIAAIIILYFLFVEPPTKPTLMSHQ